jgi:hypothetical protein
VSICVTCRNWRGQWKRHGRQALISASWGYRPPSPESVFATYRLRFGIEIDQADCTSSYVLYRARIPDYSGRVSAA